MTLPTLATTSDPRQLVPGDPAKLYEVAAAHRRLGQRLEGVGAGMNAIDTGFWRGPAKDSFGSYFFQQPRRWLQMADVHDDAARAISRYADTLSWGQAEAKKATTLW